MQSTSAASINHFVPHRIYCLICFHTTVWQKLRVRGKRFLLRYCLNSQSDWLMAETETALWSETGFCEKYGDHLFPAAACTLQFP